MLRLFKVKKFPLLFIFIVTFSSYAIIIGISPYNVQMYKNNGNGKNYFGGFFFAGSVKIYKLQLKFSYIIEQAGKITGTTLIRAQGFYLGRTDQSISLFRLC